MIGGLIDGGGFHAGNNVNVEEFCILNNQNSCFHKSKKKIEEAKNISLFFLQNSIKNKKENSKWD